MIQTADQTINTMFCNERFSPLLAEMQAELGIHITPPSSPNSDIEQEKVANFNQFLPFYFVSDLNY